MALRVGVVGLGRGAVLHRALALQPGCEVIAASSRRLVTAQAYAAANGVPRAYGSYAELLADQDVNTVVVASPAPNHAEQSIAALAAGKHVISEVPAAYDLEQCAALGAAVEAARGRATYLFAENANYASQMQSWQGIVERGLIGKIIYAESQYVHDLRDRLRDASGQLTWRAHLPPIHYCTHEIGPILALLAAGGQRDRSYPGSGALPTGALCRNGTHGGSLRLRARLLD